jgi:hypothetical protein
MAPAESTSVVSAVGGVFLGYENTRVRCHCIVTKGIFCRTNPAMTVERCPESGARTMVFRDNPDYTGIYRTGRDRLPVNRRR